MGPGHCSVVEFIYFRFFFFLPPPYEVVYAERVAEMSAVVGLSDQ